jgi:putative nucleotidyltransferase with HDIG domain
MQTATETNSQSAAGMAAFGFVQELTRELNKGTIELPSFPDIAMKIKRVLEDENSSADRIARVVSTEPGLASRVLKLANSAAYKRGDQAILDVKRAVGRLGQAAIRALAISFAIQNLMDTRSVAALKSHLNDLWNHSVHVAAIAHCLARRTDNVDPEEAMFVGLIHDVGKLYILTKIEGHPELFADEDSVNDLMSTWHTAIGQSIVENWEFAPQVIAAVAEHEDTDRRNGGATDLVDVLCAANLLCNALEDKSVTEMDFSDYAAFRKVDLTAESFADLMEQSKEEIAAMMSALNG